MNTSATPPGGWIWHEPSTGWWAPHPIGFTFDQQVQNIIKHRLANPAMIAKFKLSTDPSVVGQQLIQYQQKRGALANDPLPKLTPPRSTPQLSGAVKQAVAVVRKMARGAALTFRWEERGMPHVDPEVAESRAAVCVKCPKNEKGKSLTEYFTEPVAAVLKKKMERQAAMNLKTSHDDDLAVCQACLCPMKNKVWFPEDLIVEDLKPEQKSELHESCWILRLPSPTPSLVKAPSQQTTSPVSSEVGS